MPFHRGSVAQFFSSCASLNCRSMMFSFFSQNLALFVTAGVLDAREFARATRVVRIGRVGQEGTFGSAHGSKLCWSSMSSGLFYRLKCFLGSEGGAGLQACVKDLGESGFSL